MQGKPLKYAGFWKRAWALLMDFLILFPISILIFWIFSNSKNYFSLYVVINLIISFFYSIYAVKKLGGTLGKLIIGIIIVKTDGSSVGWREALLRSIVDIIFSLLIAASFFIASLEIDYTDYSSLSLLEKSGLLTMKLPSWYRPIDILQSIWFCADLIAVLTNRKRRSLRDRIAGTVVVNQEIPYDQFI